MALLLPAHVLVNLPCVDQSELVVGVGHVYISRLILNLVQCSDFISSYLSLVEVKSRNFLARDSISILQVFLFPVIHRLLDHIDGIILATNVDALLKASSCFLIAPPCIVVTIFGL